MEMQKRFAHRLIQYILPLMKDQCNAYSFHAVCIILLRSKCQYSQSWNYASYRVCVLLYFIKEKIWQWIIEWILKTAPVWEDKHYTVSNKVMH